VSVITWLDCGQALLLVIRQILGDNLKHLFTLLEWIQLSYVV
jgi:hypothetical protein